MRSIEPSEPIIIPHKQEDAYQMEFGFVPDVFSYPDDPDEPLSGYIYSNENNYLDISKLDGFDSIPLQLGDQLTVSFDEGGMDLENNTIIAKTIDIKSVSDLDFNDLDNSDLELGDPYRYDVDCNDLSVYSLISILMNYGTVTCKKGANNQWTFKGYETIVSVFFDDGTYTDMSVYQYTSHDEMKVDAYNMSKDGEYNKQEINTKEYHYKIGKIIITVRDLNETNNNNTERLVDILSETIGIRYAESLKGH